MTSYDRTTQDLGNVVSLDHLNVTIADQQAATLFYIVGLGFTRDPYLTVGLENMWLNAGRQQFHVPTSGTAQVVRGQIGLVVPDLGELAERLASVASGLASTQFAYVVGDGEISVTGPWGNRFRCTAPSDSLDGAAMGLSSIEFDVPKRAAKGIANFYREVIGARAEAKDGVATVHCGLGQAMVFRETAEPLGSYDGHHVAIYLADFSGPHDALADRGLVTEESNDHQYRFKTIADPGTGAELYELEHEVRSMLHPMYARPLVNRDPSINTRNYSRGADVLRIG